jgi:signal transduction histidine kinase/tetratricopeptide (TPR) repeat protein
MSRFLFITILFVVSCSNPKKDLYDFTNYEQIEDKSSFLDSLYKDVDQSSNESMRRQYLLKIAARYSWINKDRKFKKTINETYGLAKEANDTLLQAKVYHLFGDYYDSKQVSDSAYYYYLKAEKLYSNIDDNKINLAKVVLYKANILYQQGIYTESERAIIRALQIISDLDNTRLQYEANALMSLVQDDLKEFDTALEYYKNTLHLLNKLELEKYDKTTLQRSWISYHNNIGNFYNEINNFEEASYHIKTALNSPSIQDYPKLKAILLNNYASNQIQLNAKDTFIDSLFNASYEILDDINYKQGIANNKLEYAKFYLNKNDTIRAIKSLEQSLKISLDDNYAYELKESLKLLSLYDKSNKNDYTGLYIKVQDSLNQINIQTKNKFARIEFETNKIEEQVTLLTRANSYLFISILLLIILLFSTIISSKLKTKNRALITLQKENNSIQQIQELLLQQQSITNNAIRSERQRIANDLHDSIINKIFTSRLNLQELDSNNLIQKNKILNELQLTEQHVRNLSHNIHKYLFDSKQQYTEILNNLVKSQKNQFNTTFSCSVDKEIDWEIFSIQEKTHLYLILQELLQNVNKHSQAKKCMVFLFKQENAILFRVIDNGVGINFSKNKKGIGYNSIYSRLKNFNATLEIESINRMNTISITFIVI